MNILIRYILNSRKRIKCVLDYEVEEIKQMVPFSFFEHILSLIPITCYPLTKSILKEEFPTYVKQLEEIPDTLKSEEEAYAKDKYEDLVAKGILLKNMGLRKQNKKYYRKILEELRGLEEDLERLEAEEKEFSVFNIPEYIEEDKNVIESIIPTPFTKLNQQLAGGFVPGRIYAFEAPPKSKKSMLMLYVGLWLAKKNFKVFYISTELMVLETRERLAAMLQEGEIFVKKYNEMSKEELNQKLGCITGDFNYKFFSPGSVTIKTIEEYLKNKDYQLLIIDHASNYHIMPNYTTKYEKEWELEKRVYGDILGFARRTMKPVLIPTFLNRGGIERIKKFNTVDAYDTAGAFAKNAIVDAMWAIKPRDDKENNETCQLSFIPIYLRRGENREEVLIEFNKKYCTFNQHISMEDEAKMKVVDSFKYQK